MSLSKKRALSMRVRSVSVLTRVPEASDDPGSLKPTCPSVPMPRICTSMPPAASIAASYAAPAPATLSPSSSAVPFSASPGTCTLAGSSPSGSTTVRWMVAWYDSGCVSGRPMYSSSAKPRTLDTSIPSSLTIVASARYAASGLEPVASPSTASGLALIRSATQRPYSSPASCSDLTMITSAMAIPFV